MTTIAFISGLIIGWGVGMFAGWYVLSILPRHGKRQASGLQQGAHNDR